MGGSRALRRRVTSCCPARGLSHDSGVRPRNRQVADGRVYSIHSRKSPFRNFRYGLAQLGDDVACGFGHTRPMRLWQLRFVLMAIGLFGVVSSRGLAAPIWGTQLIGNLEASMGSIPCSGCGTVAYRNGNSGTPYVIGSSFQETSELWGIGEANGNSYASRIDFFGSAAPGVLKVSTRTHVQASSPGSDGANILANVDGRVGFTDDITIVSSSLPIGTFVDLDVSWSLRRSASAFGNTQVTLSFNGLFSGECVIGSFRCDYYRSETLFDSQTTSEWPEYKASYRVAVGSTYNLQGVLLLLSLSNVQQGPGPRTSQGIIDAGDSAYAYIDVLTPGADFVSASGHRYAADAVAVPEPSTSLTVGGGAMFALLARRRIRTQLLSGLSHAKPRNQTH
jgi:hypothetical protein